MGQRARARARATGGERRADRPLPLGAVAQRQEGAGRPRMERPLGAAARADRAAARAGLRGLRVRSACARRELGPDGEHPPLRPNAARGGRAPGHRRRAGGPLAGRLGGSVRGRPGDVRRSVGDGGATGSSAPVHHRLLEGAGDLRRARRADESDPRGERGLPVGGARAPRARAEGGGRGAGGARPVRLRPPGGDHGPGDPEGPAGLRFRRPGAGGPRPGGPAQGG